MRAKAVASADAAYLAELANIDANYKREVAQAAGGHQDELVINVAFRGASCARS